MTTPGEVDEARVRELARRRRRAYDAEGTLVVPAPSLPLLQAAEAGSPGLHDDRRPLLGCATSVLAVVYLGKLVDAALVQRPDLVTGVRVLMGAALVGVAVSLWRLVHKARGKRALATTIALPWQDVLDGLRLGTVEPANPAWGVALGCAAQVQETVTTLRRQALRSDASPDPELLDALHESAALVHATSEAWREQEARRPAARRTSPLDRLPGVVGPTAREASVASDAASDAATAALGLGDHDIDFDHYARRRAGMYRRRTGPNQECQDPRGPLLDASFRVEGARRRTRVALRVLVVAAVLAALLLWVGLAWASTVPAGVAALAAVAASRSMVRDPAVVTAGMPPGQAMAWTDYLDAVRVADSGRLPVTTVEAIRGCEPRVRAILVELVSVSASPVERAELETELYRLCSEVWTLVGQARAEDELVGGGGTA